MTTQNQYDGITNTVMVGSDDGKPSCELCSFQGDDEITTRINHYITDHGYKLLHIGQETSSTSANQLFQMTVAILGK